MQRPVHEGGGMKRKRSIVVAAVAGAIAATLAGGIAWAAIPGDGGVIQACYLKLGGGLRVIDTAKGQRCLTSVEVPVSWNQAGQPGATGQAGPIGPPGPQGGKGDDGDPGRDGAQGVQGVPGERGQQGEQGPPGPQGLQGLPGQDGAQGTRDRRGSPEDFPVTSLHSDAAWTSRPDPRSSTSIARPASARSAAGTRGLARSSTRCPAPPEADGSSGSRSRHPRACRLSPSAHSQQEACMLLALWLLAKLTERASSSGCPLH